MNDKRINCFRHLMKDFDNIMRKPKWDVIESGVGWKYITCVEVNVRKNLTIHVTLDAANLRHGPHKPILDNYRQLIEEDLAHYATPPVSWAQGVGAAQPDTNDEEAELTEDM